MAHFPKPYFRDKRNTWYVQIDGREHTLGRDRDAAFKRYHELMAKPPEMPKPKASGKFVVEVLDTFLDWAKANREPRTFDFYQMHLQAFADAIPKGLLTSDLKPYHVTQVMDAHPGWGSNFKHNFARSVQRAFRWAHRQELIDRNPVEHVDKPPMEARELAVSPADYAAALGAVKEPNFRDLLRFAWESGVRPQEVIAIEPRHVDLEQRRIVFPKSESKGRKAMRVIYLTAEAASIIAPLLGQDRVFLNSEGRPWTPDAINCAFCRLKKKIGKKLHLGAFRKGWVTEALKNGVDTNTAAHLAGHVNAVMISRIYAKVQQDPEYMARAMERAKGSKP